MKILPKLIEKLKNANTIEEKKQVFLDAGIELDDKELNQISAGKYDSDDLLNSRVELFPGVVVQIAGGVNVEGELRDMPVNHGIDPTPRIVSTPKGPKEIN